MDQHLQNPEKQRHNFKTFRIIFDDEYSKSVALDYEQKLIKCFTTDNKFKVVNKNLGQSSSHNYYQRQEFNNKFGYLWEELINAGVATNPLDKLENKELYKFSPYNTLTEEQNDISVRIINDFCDKLENTDNHEGISLINGCAGTGKTVLAVSIINSIANAKYMDYDQQDETDTNSEKLNALLRLKAYLESPAGFKGLKIGFVLPMTSIRKTIRDVFRQSRKNLKAEMIIGPSDLKDETYDILFVDESHRLSRRKNLTAFGAFDATCVKLGFDPHQATQLDWILKQGKYDVLFYDKDQSIKSTDITYQQFHDTIQNSGKPLSYYELSTQMRCAGGDDYITYLKNIIECRNPSPAQINNYDFKLYDNVDDMVNEIKTKNNEFGLCRTVAGYSWRWVTKPNNPPKNDMETFEKIKESGMFDIDIQGNHYIWNLATEDWISRDDSSETIGCIHTIQGFDLNYVGIIFGEEIDYDEDNNTMTVDLNQFYDIKVKSGCSPETVKRFIINTYTTMMARGIKGCYVYACNTNLKKYLERFIPKSK